VSLQIQAKLLVDLFRSLLVFPREPDRLPRNAQATKGADREKAVELSKSLYQFRDSLIFVNLPMKPITEHHSESSVPCVSLALGTAVFLWSKALYSYTIAAARTDDDSFFRFTRCISMACSRKLSLTHSTRCAQRHAIFSARFNIRRRVPVVVSSRSLAMCIFDRGHVRATPRVRRAIRLSECQHLSGAVFSVG